MTNLAQGTWLQDESLCYPDGGMHRKARVICPDGKARIVRCGIPDTFFSIPARCKANGRTVAGFVMVKKDELAAAPWYGPEYFAFVPYKYRKNADAFKVA